MNTDLWRLFLAACLLCASSSLSADVVISDDGVSMSKEELEYVVSRWPAQMQREAANDLGDRLELLNKAVASKKIAGEAMRMTPEKDGAAYWEKELLVRKALQDLMVKRFLANIDVPDMTPLARERYATEKNKYAWVSPSRLSSHILLMCVRGSDCDVDAKRKQAQELLAQLRAGADFEAMVLEYSDDPGSKTKKGLFDKWLTPQMSDVDRNYIKGVFAIEKDGDYAPLVYSQFGFHIIRLEKTREGYYRSFEQVKPKIAQDLSQEYAQLAIKIYDQDYQFTDDLYIDGDVMEAIFSKYKTGP